MTLTDDDFALVRAYLAEAAGLVFDHSRRPGLTGVLAERLGATGSPDVAAYVALLRSPGGEAERQRLLDAVTVQETHFFRNPPQVEALRRRVLPELLRRAAGRERPLTIWSAGCSTGEEPYTLAMLLLELSPMLADRSGTRILATDVSAEALRAARRATYAGRTLDTAPANVRDRWFEPSPGAALQVRDEVRGLVDLQLHNLVTDPPPFGPGEVDLVVCRNVTIYFSRETTRALIARFRTVLAEGGYLLLGHSETLWQVSDEFALVPIGDAFVYRRTHDAQASAVPPPTAPEPGHPRPARVPPGRRSAGPVAGNRRPAAPSPAVMAEPLPAASAVPTPAASAVPSQAPAPASDPAALLELARTALAAGGYAEAADLAGRAAEAQPLLAPAYVVRGQALATLGLDGEALAPLRKAVYLDPGAGHAHFLLAGALARLGRHRPAAAAYRAAARTLPAVDAGTLEAYLGGRQVDELVDLCRRLADISAKGEEHVASGRRGS